MRLTGREEEKLRRVYISPREQKESLEQTNSNKGGKRHVDHEGIVMFA